ncbi:MAG TPA: APC family permease [Pyrinomonadaceae bacterium]|nr:APC family permease [Pyrinomonadaceae bacterium]
MQHEHELSTAVLQAQRGRLLRVLGLGFGLAVIIGNTVGSGILGTPGKVAAWLPGLWLFLGVWVAGGLYALLGANALAELGTMLPRSGGQYVFAHRALGPFAGFVVGWSDWLSTCGTTAAVSILIADYAGALFPALAGRSVLVALFITVAVAVLQWRGIQWGSRFQNLTSLFKALAFVALVAACFILGGGDGARGIGTETAAPPVLPLTAALMLALQAVIYTYDGWSGVIYFSEEVRDPPRDIPRALFGGVLLIIAIYLLVNLALVYVLPLERLAGDELALGTAAEVVFGPRGETIFRSLMIVSMLSGINAFHLMATRVLFAMSRDRLGANAAAQVNRGGTPAVALFLSATVAALFIVGGKRFETVINALAFFFVANYTMSFISVFVLRRREPELERPYRAWGYPWTTALALLGSVAFLAGAIVSDLSSDTRSSLYALLMLAASYPAYILLRRLSK